MTAPVAACRVLLVDDHPLMRSALGAALRKTLPRVILEEAGSAAEALPILPVLRPDLVLLDVNLPGVGGLELARRVRANCPQARILMVAGEADPWTVKAALSAGASGFVCKGESSESFASAVRTVLEGGQYLAEETRQELGSLEREHGVPREPPGPAALSERERAVLRQLAQGENTKEIAARLGISPKTVETHRQHIGRKLGIANVAELTRYALRHGLGSL